MIIWSFSFYYYFSQKSISCDCLKPSSISWIWHAQGLAKGRWRLVPVQVQMPFVLETVKCWFIHFQKLVLGSSKVSSGWFNLWYIIFTSSSFSTSMRRMAKVIIFASCPIFRISVDVVGLVDVWAACSFEELDYMLLRGKMEQHLLRFWRPTPGNLVFTALCLSLMHNL